MTLKFSLAVVSENFCFQLLLDMIVLFISFWCWRPKSFWRSRVALLFFGPGLNKSGQKNGLLFTLFGPASLAPE